MQLRTATLSDAAAIAHLHAENWRRTYRGVLQDAYLDNEVQAERLNSWEERLRAPASNQYIVVAENAGAVSGFACAFANEHPQWGHYLDNLHVAADSKGQNIGAQLMADVASWCGGTDAARGLYLWVVQANHSAIRFYQRMGGVAADEELWEPPGGGKVLTLRYLWPDLAALKASAEHRAPPVPRIQP
ncbi:GNAT family N-acetyltransferase [Undibacterium sp.]|jgi:GNAT superfamily N-acetyltransferase|uniref:GNAT family N-acetyltransferase n=1 Tax=Undibacterium sp. TaxID=1914977 RepID=UPI002B52D028|nr:GNAT family N-acetyltransferase [Undibacterium sp.]HTD06413.1 GNAT family N-acetyltransferase [Undibacterium sp.]